MIVSSQGVVSNVQDLKKASLSYVLVEQVGAYSKQLETIEMSLRVYLQLLVPAFLSMKFQQTSHSSMHLGLFLFTKCVTMRYRLVFYVCTYTCTWWWTRVAIIAFIQALGAPRVKVLTETCHNVNAEQPLQPLNDISPTKQQTLKRLVVIAADTFWGNNRQCAYFDIRVFNFSVIWHLLSG